MRATVIIFLLFPFSISALLAAHSSQFLITKCLKSTYPKPLQTAGPSQLSFIPRLEPGLILLSPQLASINDWKNVEVFPLSSLLQLAHSSEERDTQGSILAGEHIPLDRLFVKVHEGMQVVSARLRRFSRKVAAVSLLLVSALPAPTFKRMSISMGSAVAAVLSGPKLIAAARSYASWPARQRLGTTPLYFVTNSRGNAFLQEDSQSGRPGQKEIVYFLSHEDAQGVLQEMAQQHGPQAGEMRLSATSMERVLVQMESKKQSRKLGRFDVDTVLRIQPCSRQLQHAQQLPGAGLN
ncbi:hypothetical protein EON64_13940, partial [archaeon]